MVLTGMFCIGSWRTCRDVQCACQHHEPMWREQTLNMKGKDLMSLTFANSTSAHYVHWNELPYEAKIKTLPHSVTASDFIRHTNLRATPQIVKANSNHIQIKCCKLWHDLININYLLLLVFKTRKYENTVQNTYCTSTSCTLRDYGKRSFQRSCPLPCLKSCVQFVDGEIMTQVVLILLTKIITKNLSF